MQNFPIGEKFDLDGADQGERWSLPTHLVDAIFFVQCRRVTTFEQSGGALEILSRLGSTIEQGYSAKSLQRLPHVTLLNPDFYHSQLKPILAEWAYLWLQKQHLHGIEREEAIKYVLEGAVARSDLALKLRIINTAIAEVEVKLGEKAPQPDLTTGYRSSLSESERAKYDEGQLQLRRQSSAGLAPGVEQQLRRRVAVLEDARCAAEVQSKLMNEVFGIEELLEGHLRGVAQRGLELAKEMAQLQQEIEELENPRDDSMDNDTIIWCSYDAFSAGQAGMSGEPVDDDIEEDTDESTGAQSGGGGESANHGSDSVHAIIGVLEDFGMVCKRCSDPHEAIARARELQRLKRLRCVVFGGGEKTGGCGKGCRRNHENDGDCLRCGHSWYNHDDRNHDCYSPSPTQFVRRGSFQIEKPKEVAEKMGAVEFFAELTANGDTLLARENGLLPSARTCLYAGNAAVKEESRLKLWSMGTAVRESASALNEWVDGVEAWPKDEPEDGSDNDNDGVDEGVPLTRQVSVGSARLDVCRHRLAECEVERSALEDTDEEQKKQLHTKSHDKHKELMASVEERLAILSDAMTKLHALDGSTIPEGAPSRAGDAPTENIFFDIDVGPGSGRNAALAIAWLESQTTPPAVQTTQWRMTVAAALRAVASEQESLQQIALAAKVMVFIPSPTHKKLLNLTHDWLRTYLPHCLSKVNRVSFGLLSSDECAAALEDDPFCPRSRLALAVPFIGKDVPAKSAEFAHPDITLGLTVMAYRYSGLREGDFSDLVDALTSEFAHEIGPARERASSLRYEAWVDAADGTVRGVPAPKAKLPVQGAEVVEDL